MFSVAGAAVVGLYLLRYPSVRATLFDPSATFQYVVPLMVPLIAFMFERVEHVREANFFQHGVDYLTFVLAAGRVTGDVPYISGHTLLLSYALLQSKSRLVRISSALVLAQTLLLKYFVWGDLVTSNVGIALGCALSFLVTLSRRDSGFTRQRLKELAKSKKQASR